MAATKWIFCRTEDDAKDISRRVAREQGCAAGTLYWFRWAELAGGQWVLCVPEDQAVLLGQFERDKLQAEDYRLYIRGPDTVSVEQLKVELIEKLYNDVRNWLLLPDKDMDSEARDRYMAWLADPGSSDLKKSKITGMITWADEVWRGYYLLKARVTNGDLAVVFDPVAVRPCPHTFREIALCDDPGTLSGPALRARLRDLVTVHRATVLSTATVTVGAFQFDCDPAGTQNATGRMALGDVAPWPQGWRDANNEIQQLSKADFSLLCLLMSAKLQEIYQRSWVLKDVALSDTHAQRINDGDLLTRTIHVLWDTWYPV